MTLSNWYFITSIVLLAGIVYTLRRGIMHAKRLSKASIMSSSYDNNHNDDLEEDMNNFKDHISSPGGLF